jgi:hypothetical protein
MSLEALAKKAPNVSFIHDYPGPVKTGLGRGTTGVAMFLFKTVFKIIGPLINVPSEECGERHLFLVTSAKYPADEDAVGNSGVPLEDGVAVANGISGKVGSGVYSIGFDGESTGHKVEELMARFETDGTLEKLWKHTEDEFIRITRVRSS